MPALFSDNQYGIDFGSDSSLDDVDPLSISIWIKLIGWGQNDSGMIANKWSGGSYGWQLFACNDGVGATESLGFIRQRATMDAIVYASDYSLSLDEWVHIGATYQISGTKLYLNGIETSYNSNSAGSGSTNSDSGTNLLIGNSGAGERDYAGYIDDARIYDRILDQSEMQSIYVFRGHDQILDYISRWIFVEGSVETEVSTVRDLGNNKNDGTADIHLGSIDYSEGILSYRRNV